MTSTPFTVGWIGLGAIGAPMARAAAIAGFPVTAFDMNPAALTALADVATAAPSAADAARGADVVVIMVATPDQLQSVLFGDAGITPALTADSTVLIMSTVGPAALEDAAAGLAATTVRIVDAPVSGGAARAAEGDLLVMVGGAPEHVATVRPLLDALASNAPVVGEKLGDGQRFKVVNQLLCGVHIVAAGEALALAESMGLDRRQVHEVLGTGAAASFMFGDRGARMVAEEFDQVHSALTIFVKDMGLVSEAARSVSQEVPLASAAEQVYRRGDRKGWSRRDDSVVYEVLRGEG